MADTAQTVLNEDGVFAACTTRHGACGYACCQFKDDNWIMLLPGELELAEQLNLTRDHLRLQDKGHAVYAACQKPCHQGDFKPVDCSWYPLFPANATATRFLATDNRKCPIPHHALAEKMLAVHASALAYEQLYPGTLAKLPDLICDFVGYVPLPYEIINGKVEELSLQAVIDSAFFGLNPAALGRSD